MLIRNLQLEAKLEIINFYWDKLIFSIQTKAVSIRDKATQNLVSHIFKVPENIRNEALKFYLNKCIDVHAIVFQQWRKLYPSYYFEYEQGNT